MCHVKRYGSLTSSVLITLVANPVDASKAGVSVFALWQLLYLKEQRSTFSGSSNRILTATFPTAQGAHLLDGVKI